MINILKEEKLITNEQCLIFLEQSYKTIAINIKLNIPLNCRALNSSLSTHVSISQAKVLNI